MCKFSSAVLGLFLTYLEGNKISWASYNNILYRRTSLTAYFAAICWTLAVLLAVKGLLYVKVLELIVEYS